MDDLAPLPPLDEIRPEHEEYVRATLRRLRVPLHACEDLAQEVLLEAHRSRDSRLDVRALLSGIARHVWLRWYRRAARRRIAEAGAYHAAESDDVDADRRAQDRIEAVHDAIAEIGEPFRSVFVRTQLDGATAPEVARETGVPVNTVYTRLGIARERFLAALRRQLVRRRLGPGDL